MRKTAWILRYVDKCKLAFTKAPYFWPKELTAEEIEGADLKWWKLVQQDSYGTEVACLQNSKPIPKNSTLYALNPWMDADGVMRVDGKIPERPQMDGLLRHPVILPNKHMYTKLLILPQSGPS